MPKTNNNKTNSKPKTKRQPKKLPKQEELPPETYDEEEQEYESSPPVMDEAPIKNTAPTKETRGRKKKYSTPEEAHAARLEQMRQWRERRKNRVISITTPNNDIKHELMGILGQSIETAEMSPELQECLAATLQSYNN